MRQEHLALFSRHLYPLRALYDRALLNDPHTTFDNLPEVCDIKLDEHQYKIIKQMVKNDGTLAGI